MSNERLSQIREAERASHLEIYSTAELYEKGSWLQKPIKTVLDLLPVFANHQALRALDLGSGVGRNSIAVALEYRHIDCKVECVDILEYSIERLRQNAVKYEVEKEIEGIVSPIENYVIAENTYDLVMAVSALEHIDSENAFKEKLKEICQGIRAGGVVCLVINSGVTEKDKETGEKLSPQFEVNLPTQELQTILQETFIGWKILKSTIRHQQYDIPRGERTVDLETDVVTFVAQKL